MNVLDTTELYILCYVDFTMIFLKKRLKQRDKEDRKQEQKAASSTGKVVHIAPLAEP